MCYEPIGRGRRWSANPNIAPARGTPGGRDDVTVAPEKAATVLSLENNIIDTKTCRRDRKEEILQCYILFYCYVFYFESYRTRPVSDFAVIPTRLRSNSRPCYDNLRRIFVCYNPLFTYRCSPWQEEEATKDVDAPIDALENESHRSYPSGYRWSRPLGLQGSRRRQARPCPGRHHWNPEIVGQQGSPIIRSGRLPPSLHRGTRSPRIRTFPRKRPRHGVPRPTLTRDTYVHDPLLPNTLQTIMSPAPP